MASINRLLITNRVQATATVLAASSAAIASPVSRLKDQLRSKTWRSAIGWTIVAGVNDKIDFNRGGVLVATLTAGTYATGALLATEIIARLEAADATPVWACVYDVGTKTFTISSDLAFTLLFGTGTNLAASVHVDLGFATADTGSATSHTAGSVSYQSRYALTADLLLPGSMTAAIVINHNAGTGGTFTFQADTASLAAVGYVDAATPDFSQVLAGDATIRIAFFAEQTKRYVRLLINDVQNALGYSEVGIWFAGPYVETPRGFTAGWGRDAQPQNVVIYAVAGAHFVDQKPDRPIWSALNWPGLTAAERDGVMAAFATVPRGICFFFAFDAIDVPTSTEYVMLQDAADYTHMDGDAFLLKSPQLLGVLG